MKYVIGIVLASLAASGVIVALVLGTPSPAPAAPSSVPSYFCPAGQHAVKVTAGMPDCATPSPSPSPVRWVP